MENGERSNVERIKSILSDLTERANVLESSGCRKGSYIRVPVSVPSDFDVIGALREAFMSELFKEKGVGD